MAPKYMILLMFNGGGGGNRTRRQLTQHIEITLLSNAMM
jgi:hypothetical protein